MVGALVAGLAAFAVPALADQPAAVPPTDQVAQAAAPSPSPSPTPTPNPFQASGYIDMGYDQANAWGPTGNIGGRVFDNVSGKPQLQSINLTAAYTGPIGGKVELNTGTDADVIHSYPQALFICPQGPVVSCTPPYSIQADLTQAYLSGTLGKFTLIAGKFETLAGAEVIESPSDLNFSRSILFGYAVPFTHTGLRLTYAATSTFSVIVGANRGWDTTAEDSQANLAKLGAPATYSDNGDITGEFGLAWNPSSAFSWTVQAYDGQPEDQIFVGCFNGVSATNCSRTLIDTVATWHATSALTLMLNGDDAHQTNTPYFGGTGNVSWQGLAGYVSYAFNPSITETVRYEVFSDPEGYRSDMSLAPNAWREATATTQFTVSPHWIVRGELRFDDASQPIFASSYGAATTASRRWVNTVGIEGIGHIP